MNKSDSQVSNLIEKYNVAVPRYTSYPTVPHWQSTAPTQEQWLDRLISNYEDSPALSLYIHLPFCEALCTYCGCNKRITKNHAVETPYIKAVIAEWAIYLAHLPTRPVIKEIHLGGGTPTFFDPGSLQLLLDTIIDSADLADDYEFSFEAHPNSTTTEHLQVLYDLGFRRISVGVQDITPSILEAINRQQTVEEVERVTTTAREIGYTSVNYDIIYGLPFQKAINIVDTIRFIKEQRPDRIAFYSYAHVPWKSASQRAFTIDDVPTGEAKMELYKIGRTLLEAEGYKSIGMDHFCLADEALYKAYEQGEMHRNFMGYTPNYTKCSIALGASSISDCWDAYVQNEKKIEDYQAIVQSGRLPIIKGHLLNKTELEYREHILNLFCRDFTDWKISDVQGDKSEVLFQLASLEEDGLIEWSEDGLHVTDLGQYYIRNICAAIDPIFQSVQSDQQVFSRAI